MARNRNVNVVIKGDYDDSDIKRAMRELGKLGNVADDQHSRLGGLGKTAGVALVAGLAAAGAATIAFGKASVDAAQDAQVADARYAAVAKSMGYVDGAYAGATKRAGEYATSLSKQIGVEDESIKAVQAKILTFKAVGDTVNQAGGAFDRATKAAYDMAAAGFGTAEGNATQLGKALQDPIKGVASLAKSGVTFTQAEKDKMKALVESGQAAKAQEMILKAVETQTGGTAAATATSAAKMKVSFGELEEKVGASLLPVLSKLADVLGPLFEKLQEPLGKVADMVGGALGKAFEALAPVLPVLADALGKIAGVLGVALATAIEALVPIVTPLLQILGTLAEKIGPILAPILEKIGTLLGEVLAAVMPLIQPLTEVVMGILDAAAPILGVVVDALIILVRALAPVLAAVGQLIQPLGQLIMVLLKAIMPVIQPLLPVIEALATVLGDVLTRAVGLIMTALGFMIQGWAKLAPFILNNVTKPVVEAFLTMAENVVGAAADMLGWVPGLGDKLNEAKDSIAKFKTPAGNAIADAAKTIGTEGEKIGKNLVDQGVGMMTDPSQVQKVKNAGIGLGKDLGAGVKQGVDASAAALGLSTAALMNHAEQAARNAAQTHSPSVLFANIGKDLVSGLVKGVEDGGKEVRKNLQEAFTSWFSDTIDKLKDKLKEAKDAFKSFKDEVSAAITGGINFSDAAQEFDEQGKAVGKTFIQKLTEQASQAQAFAVKVKELIAAGLSKEALQNVLAAGVTAGTSIANELIAGGATAISTTNELVKSTQDAADSVGALAAEKWYGAGVKQAQKTYEGFRDNFGKDGEARKALMNVMDRLAADAARNVKINVDVVENVTRKVTTIMSNGTPQVQGATGGVVNVPTVALIGEAGPEAVIPLDRSPGNGPVGALGGGNTYSITVQAGVGDPRAIGQQIVEYIKKYEVANSPVFAAA